MLIIRSEQIKVFQADAESAFVRRVMDYLKENHAETLVRLPHSTSSVAELPDEILQTTVQSGIKRGSSYGIALKSTLLSFVVILFLAAPNFDEHPKAVSFFSQKENIDDNDFEGLIDEMTDEDWAEVEARYNNQMWNLPIVKGVSQ